MISIPLLNRRKAEALLDSLALEIANACRQAVRMRVQHRCDGMSVLEMRGYVRARAAEPVRRQASQRLNGQAGLSPRDWRTVIQRATDRVVQLVVREGVGAGFAADVYRRAA